MGFLHGTATKTQDSFIIHRPSPQHSGQHIPESVSSILIKLSKLSLSMNWLVLMTMIG